MRILIVSNNMHIGGVQKALVDMLHNIPGTFDVTLALFNPSGEYMKDIPTSVRLLPVRSLYKYLGFTSCDAKTFTDKLLRAIFAGITRLFGRKYAVSIMSLTQKKLDGFDIAISFIHNPSETLFLGGCNDFVLRHVPADKKITFLHCDFGKIKADTTKNRKDYPKFDVIAACSKGCLDAFLSVMPYLSDKGSVVTNFHNFEDIRKKADSAPVSMPKTRLNILSVARLGREKGIMRAVGALSKIHGNFHYYIVGDGIEREKIETFIRDNNLSDNVTLCGELSNPYGYMKEADLLLIPSLSEAAPVVIDEAASLCTPILSTATSSTAEMISDRNIGWVCENTDDAIYAALDRLVNTPSLVYDKKTQLQTMTFDNSAALDQLCGVLEL